MSQDTERSVSCTKHASRGVFQNAKQSSGLGWTAQGSIRRSLLKPDAVAARARLFWAQQTSGLMISARSD
jgi:hypothetical protein